MQTRRAFSISILQSVTAASLGALLLRTDAIAQSFRPNMVRWLLDLNAAARDLKDKTLTPAAAQALFAGYMRDIDMIEFLRLIDYDRLATTLELPESGESNTVFEFPRIDGLPQDLAFKSELTAMSRGRSIPPHGHNNQLTAFLVLEGELRARQFDRLDEDRNHLILTPTLDTTFRRGDVSTISDEQGNVHWFNTLSERTVMYNLVISKLTTRPFVGSGRVPLDLRGGELGRGRVRGTRISLEKSYALYG